MNTVSNFIQILNNPVTRKLVDAIEDTRVSLRDYPEGDATLQECLEYQIEELYKVSGFKYELN